MIYLVGDIGNTLVKFSFLDRNFKIIKTFRLETRKILEKFDERKILDKILKENINKKVLFSSVVPKAFIILKKLLNKKKFKAIEIKNLKIQKILKIKIKNYNQLGSDRICNALGSLNHKRCIIIDFGTATTFDIINNKSYLGGVISPGVDLSIVNLNKSTALLPLINLKKKQSTYGKNTKEALNAGFLWGYEGLINNIIKKISSKSKMNYKIILTGGYASLFKNYVKGDKIIDENVTMKGLAKAFKELI